MFANFRRPSRPASDEPFVPPSADQVRRLFAYLRPYRGRMAIALLALIFGPALGLLQAIIAPNLPDPV